MLYPLKNVNVGTDELLDCLVLIRSVLLAHLCYLAQLSLQSLHLKLWVLTCLTCGAIGREITAPQAALLVAGWQFWTATGQLWT